MTEHSHIILPTFHVQHSNGNIPVAHGAVYCGSGGLGCTKGAREGCVVVWDMWDMPKEARKGGQGAGHMGGVPVRAGMWCGSVCEREVGGAQGISVRGVTCL